MCGPGQAGGVGYSLLLAERGTYEIVLGGLAELVLGGLSDIRICTAVSQRAGRGRVSQRRIPGESVPSNTWLISMIAEGACEGQRSMRVKEWRVKCEFIIEIRGRQPERSSGGREV